MLLQGKGWDLGIPIRYQTKGLLMKVRYILWVKPYIDAGQPCAVWKETLIVERFMIGL